METADISACHDLGPKHFDSNLFTLVQTSQNKSNYPVPHDATISSSIAFPQFFLQVFSFFIDEKSQSTITPLSEYPTRAPPA